MTHLVGHGLPSQDAINTTERSFTHTNRYYITGTTTENRRGKRKNAGHDHNKAKARWICCCLDEDIAGQTFLITNRSERCDVVVWSLCKLPQ